MAKLRLKKSYAVSTGSPSVPRPAYAPETAPAFRLGGEVAGPATVELYRCGPAGGKPPVRALSRPCGPDDFCCLNPREWRLVRAALGMPAA